MPVGVDLVVHRDIKKGQAVICDYCDHGKPPMGAQEWHEFVWRP